jgi:rhodanese-related sulfurtransferase
MTGLLAAEFSSVDDLLAEARSRLARLDVAAAGRAIAAGARLVDIRPAWQRAREGEIPGSLIVERNHLEWRLHPGSPARLTAAVAGQRWIVVCSEGYTSSLAAAVLCSLGVPATDLVGGVRAWAAAGRPITSGPTRVESVVRSRGPAPRQGTGSGSAHLGDPGRLHVEHEAPH